MNKFCYLLLLLLITQSYVTAQNSVNDYKYIVIPKQFEFQKYEDQYQLNSLTKFLFNKYGFTAFFEDESVPADLNQNRCLGLKSVVKKVKGSFLRTKVQIDLKDCKGNIVMSSQIGDTKEKDFAKAYNLAIREAFQTFQLMDYSYVPNENILQESTTSIAVKMSEEKEREAQNEIERLKKEVEALKEKEKLEAVEVETKPTEVTNSEPKKEDTKKAVEALQPIEAVDAVKEDMLYAQPIVGGFQVVDTEPKKVMILLHSGIPDTYLVQGKDAMVYKQKNTWVYAENDGKNLVVKGVNLKF
ncbi:hypothetical protein [Psychroserpens algicola]|uniref:hypothetical protein n=1 Tax=Psychroserpens algicola TaxID=1719034 RepID=UPI001953579E|nr:hypothetical protein [Psychroserpens algicola]